MANKKRHFLFLYELSMHNHQTRRNINQCWLQSNQQFTFRWSVIVSEHSNHSPAHMCGLNFCSAPILPKAKLHRKPFEISFDSESVFPRGFGRINIQEPSNQYKKFRWPVQWSSNTVVTQGRVFEHFHFEKYTFDRCKNSSIHANMVFSLIFKKW